MIVLTVATPKNQFVEEFEYQLQKLGYKYKVLGEGVKWKGFETKIELYDEVLSNMNPEKIVIICDSYDLLFLEGPGVIMEKYDKIAKGKVLIGLENISDLICRLSSICIPRMIEKCKIENKYYSHFKYINSGFIMGKAKDLKEIFNFMKENKHKDDQLGLISWVSENCDRVVFDYHLDIIANLLPYKIFNVNDDIFFEIEDGKIKVGESFPSVIHFPGQSMDFGYRSENLRNMLIPGRSSKPRLEYFKEEYKNMCTKDSYHYMGIWGPIILILILMIIITTSCTNSK